MALLFFDGCQWGTSGSADAGWDVSTTLSYLNSGGPFGDRFAQSLNVSKTLGVNVATLIIGYWWNSNAGALTNHWIGFDGATAQFALQQTAFTTGYGLQIRNGTAGAILGVTGQIFSNFTWRWVEWKIPLGNSVTVECRVDGLTVINVSGVDTTTTANDFITRVTANSSTSLLQMGCITVCDATGSSQNDFLGPQRASVLVPTDADTGTFNQWTASTGTRTSCVDESPTPNGDTDYISSNTPGHQQSFTLQNLPATPAAINGLGVYTQWRRDDAGPHTARVFLRDNGGTIVNHTTESIAATFETKAYIHNLSPFTSAQWTKAEIDGLQAGLELVS